MKELKKTFDTNKKLGISLISNYYVSKYNLRTIKEAKPEMYMWEKGVYGRAEQQIEAELSEFLGQDYSIHNRNEIFNQIHAKTYTNRELFDSDKYLINLRNGIYDLQHGTFLPHSPEYLFFTRIETDYNPDATCHKLNAFFNQLLSPENIILIKQWFGYCLFKDYFIKKALIMTGVKDTGKTTLIDLFIKLIGLKNMSGVSLQAMASDKFSISDMYQKHINIYDDLSAQDVKDGGRFKMVTGRSPISAEYKHGNRFSFYNYAKLTFACNRIPNVEDNDDAAYFSRWLIIDFTRVVDKPDKFLLDKIATDDQLSGLLNEMLVELNKLIVNQKFSYDKGHEEIKAEMLKSGSPVASFAYDCLSEAIGFWTSKSDLHFWFLQYVKRNSLPHVEIKKFGKELIKYARYCTEGTMQGQRGWNNVKVDENFTNKYVGNIPNNSSRSKPNEVGLSGKEDGQPLPENYEIEEPYDERAEDESTGADNILRERLDEAI